MFWITSSPLEGSLLASSSSSENGNHVIDQGLEDRRENSVTLVGITHYRAPSRNSVLGIIHHFGVLEVRLPNMRHQTVTLIKFEKVKLRGEGLPAGRVTVEVIPETSLGPNDEMVHEVKLPEDCQRIRMGNLLDLLTTSQTLRYSLWRNNCWKYVYDCQYAMLRKFAELPGTSAACRRSLEVARRNLPKPSLLSDVFHWQKLLFSFLRASLISFSVQGVHVIVKLIKFAFSAVRAMGVRGLGTSLSRIRHIRDILRTLGLIPVVKILLGLLNWKAVAVGIAGIIILTVVVALLRCVSDNTTLLGDLFQSISDYVA